MLTIFSVPKAFTGPFATIQSNAIGSWMRLACCSEVILFGDDQGIEEAAGAHGCGYVPKIEKNEFGTPLLNDVFSKARRMSEQNILCFVNADMILMDDLCEAVGSVTERGGHFMMVGRRCNLDVVDRLEFEPGWALNLRDRVQLEGVMGTPYWIDYFAFNKDLFGELPPFAVGRPGYDNWLIWHAKKLGAAVVDASSGVMAVHQNHDYSHAAQVSGRSLRGHALAHGQEAALNRALMGDWTTYQTTSHADFVLAGAKVRRAYDMEHLLARIGLFWRWLVVASRPLRRGMRSQGKLPSTFTRE